MVNLSYLTNEKFLLIFKWQLFFIMTLKKTDLAKHQGLQIASRMKNARKAGLYDKQAKGMPNAKPAPLLQSILSKTQQGKSKS